MSTREWTPSESIPELPERDAAVNCGRLFGDGSDYDIGGECRGDGFGSFGIFVFVAGARGAFRFCSHGEVALVWFDRFGAEAVSVISFEELSRPSFALRKGL